jgi:hypothetical protein
VTSTRADRWIPILALALVACEREPRDPSDYPAECPENTQWDGTRCVTTQVVAAPPSSGIDPMVGAFVVSGTRSDGKGYSGAATITAIAAGGPYKLTYTLNGESFNGLGTRRGDILSVGWADAKDYGVVDYVARGDGTLDGVWYDTTSTAPGREILTGGLTSLAGVYSIQKGQAPSGAAYTGTCDLAVTGDLHTLVWHVGKDTFRGLGVRDGDVLSVGFSTAATGNFGVIQYKLAGADLVGRWAEWNQKVPTLGQETLSRSPK